MPFSSILGFCLLLISMSVDITKKARPVPGWVETPGVVYSFGGLAEQVGPAAQHGPVGASGRWLVGDRPNSIVQTMHYFHAAVLNTVRGYSIHSALPVRSQTQPWQNRLLLWWLSWPLPWQRCQHFHIPLPIWTWECWHLCHGKGHNKSRSPAPPTVGADWRQAPCLGGRKANHKEADTQRVPDGRSAQHCDVRGGPSG